MRARVVHVSDSIPGAVYIGRAMPRRRLVCSPFCNPFKIGSTFGSRADVIELYKHHMIAGQGRFMLDQLPELRGKPLACWCRHDGEEYDRDVNGCHGDVLVALLDRYSDDELRAMSKYAERTQR